MGLVVLVPLAILFLAAMEVYGLLDDMANFAEFALPFPGVVNAAIFIVLAVLAVFADAKQQVVNNTAVKHSRKNFGFRNRFRIDLK
jgi:hypothetical protein